MTLIERMAKAMLAAEHREVGYSGDIEPLWNELSKTDRARLCLYARAALGALQGEEMEASDILKNEAVDTAFGDLGIAYYHYLKSDGLKPDTTRLDKALAYTVSKILEAAAPYLRAPLVARLAEVEAERDAARTCLIDALQCIGKVGLDLLNSERGAPNDWPAGQEWDDLVPTSQSICRKRGAEALGLDYWKCAVAAGIPGAKESRALTGGGNG